MPTLLSVIVVSGILTGCAAPARQYPSIGTIERLDPRFDKLVPADAELEKLVEGFEWTEGPLWVPALRSVLFSDIPNNVVHQWNEADGLAVYLKPSGYTGARPRGGEPGSNGLLLDAEGRLVLCEHGDRRVTRLEKDRTRTVLADRYKGKRFNSPNDAVFRSNGDLYFTDPPYGLEKGADDPARELDFCGVFAMEGGRAKLLLSLRATPFAARREPRPPISHTL